MTFSRPLVDRGGQARRWINLDTRDLNRCVRSRILMTFDQMQDERTNDEYHLRCAMDKGYLKLLKENAFHF